VGAPGTESLIVPIMILLMHASSTLDRQASAFHVQGLLKLIRFCGPRRFTTDPLRQAFESCRATLITVALITRSRSFLEQDEWLRKPWSACGENNKNEQNRLVDILVHVPGFLEDQAQLECTPSEYLRLDLIQRIEAQLAKAYNWRWRWEETNADVAWEVEPEILPPNLILQHHRPIRKVLIFSSFSKATELCLYNAVLLFLLGLLWTLEPPPCSSYEPMRLSQSSLAMPGDVDSLIEPAIEICRAFEYQLLNVKQSRDSALFWLFPLGMASRALEDDLEYMAWIRDMLDASQVTRGYGRGDNTYGFGFYKFPKVRRRRSLGRPMIQPQYDADWVRHVSDGSSSSEDFL